MTAVELYQQGLVTKEEAISACSNEEGFERIISGIYRPKAGGSSSRSLGYRLLRTFGFRTWARASSCVMSPFMYRSLMHRSMVTMPSFVFVSRTL